MENTPTPPFPAEELPDYREQETDRPLPADPRARRAQAVMTAVRPAGLPRWKARYLKKYPDAVFDDDEAMKAAFYEDYDRSEQQRRMFEEDNDRLIELVREYPELGTLFAELFKGTPLRVAMLKADFELPEPAPGEEDYIDYYDARNEHRQRMAERERRMREYEMNAERSKAEIDEFFRTKALTPEQEKAFTEYVDNLVGDMINGIFSQQSLEKLYRSYTYEEDVRTAHEAGEIDGRNAAIETRRLALRRESDGLPSGAGASMQENSPRKTGYIERLMASKY